MQALYSPRSNPTPVRRKIDLMPPLAEASGQ